MQKMQILFPEPQLQRLRRIAERQDRPVSELVRNAVELWLSRQGGYGDFAEETPPVYHCGQILTPPEQLRAEAQADRSGR